MFSGQWQFVRNAGNVSLNPTENGLERAEIFGLIHLSNLSHSLGGCHSKRPTTRSSHPLQMPSFGGPASGDFRFVG